MQVEEKLVGAVLGPSGRHIVEIQQYSGASVRSETTKQINMITIKSRLLFSLRRFRSARRGFMHQELGTGSSLSRGRRYDNK